MHLISLYAKFNQMSQKIAPSSKTQQNLSTYTVSQKSSHL